MAIAVLLSQAIIIVADAGGSALPPTSAPDIQGWECIATEEEEEEEEEEEVNSYQEKERERERERDAGAASHSRLDIRVQIDR